MNVQFFNSCSQAKKFIESNPTFMLYVRDEDFDKNLPNQWAVAGYPCEELGEGWIEYEEPSRAGTAPDTSLNLGDRRRVWLRKRGGIQPTICAMIDRAMRRNP